MPAAYTPRNPPTGNATPLRASRGERTPQTGVPEAADLYDSAKGKTKLAASYGGPRRFLWWYDTIIDYMLAQPRIKHKELAKLVGCSSAWLATIMASDTFKLHYARRRADMNARIAETVSDEVTGRATDLAISALDLALDRFKENPKSISTPLALETADKMLNRLGYGGAPAPTTQVNVGPGSNVAVVSAPEAFARARDRLKNPRAIEGGPSPPVNSNVVEAKAEPTSGIAQSNPAPQREAEVETVDAVDA